MIRIGARRSPLAVAQAKWVAAQIVALGHDCEVIGIDTLGDVDRRRLTEIGGTGIFATAVRDRLRDHSIDVAVHSLKDLPVAQAPGLVVAAIPAREDVRDVLVGLPVEQWGDGTVVGTGSPRRAIQVEALAAQRGITVKVVPIRGNVDTRLDLVRHGDVDATLLAAAGLLRLGRLEARQVTTPITQSQDVRIQDLPARLLGTDVMLPAAGQGALGVECRIDASDEVLTALAELDHAATRAAVTAERSFLSTLEAGCLAPVGAHGVVTGDDLTIRTVAGQQSSNDSASTSAGTGPLTVMATRSGTAADAQGLGAALAAEVLPQIQLDHEQKVKKHGEH
ncbi:hydroxymethylbilane synthase [Luteococcus sp. Sow4_B9]|uniref:hydroxymethylbilane synthase n=1 Tax=Luteococcus sp. Sow4_B9 TaxID=3438792 RepID=UPI003F94FEF2